MSCWCGPGILEPGPPSIQAGLAWFLFCCFVSCSAHRRLPVHLRQVWRGEADTPAAGLEMSPPGLPTETDPFRSLTSTECSVYTLQRLDPWCLEVLCRVLSHTTWELHRSREAISEGDRRHSTSCYLNWQCIWGPVRRHGGETPCWQTSRP